MIKVVFFDGDGTLWYPSRTKRHQKPHWVYNDPGVKDPVKEFIVTPGTVETLEELGRRNIKRVLLSTSPLSTEEAIIHRIEVLRHVDLHHLLDDIQVAPNQIEGKGQCIEALLEKYGLTKAEALMVGDTYAWDYEAARKVDVRALLIKSDYAAEFLVHLDPVDVIDDLRDVLKLI
jgi:FMN phosphatase YigB (HAD superfamily)